MNTGAALILEIEELAANAWPAAEVEMLGGWRLRHTHGVTRRANSVWPNRPPVSESLDHLFERVEAFYTTRQQPARYQISPVAQPPELDDRLAGRGYTLEAPTAVQTADLARVMRRTISASQPDGATRTDISVQLEEQVDEAWFSAYCAAECLSGAAVETRRAILARIAPDAAYALASIDGEPAALGSGVVEGDWLGIFNMTTRREFRRRGAARAMLRSLAAWAMERGATRGYLQVMAENLPAQTLYATAGFATVYHYHYRERALV